VALEFRRLHGEQGNAMVEFALSVAVLLTLLFGIIDVGRALYAYDWLYNGARQATRWAMVRGSHCDSHLQGCPTGATNDTITQYVTNQLPAGYGNGLDATGIDISAVTVSSKCFSANIASVPPCGPTSYLQVQITYQFQFITPFLTQFKSWTMTSTSERVVQGNPVS
jgi:Flp pilus assembly protein TadG